MSVIRDDIISTGRYCTVNVLVIITVLFNKIPKSLPSSLVILRTIGRTDVLVVHLIKILLRPALLFDQRVHFIISFFCIVIRNQGLDIANFFVRELPTAEKP